MSKETSLGKIACISGSLIFADGIVADHLPVGPRQQVTVDLGRDNVVVEVLAVQNGGKRFLVIPLSSAETIPQEEDEIVSVIDKAEVPEPDNREKKDNVK